MNRTASRGRRRACRLVIAVGAFVFASCSSSGSSPAASSESTNTPTVTDAVATTIGEVTDVDPAPSEPDASEPDDGTGPGDTGVVPEGFTTVTALITKADGTTCEVCMWLADDGAERGRGLMGVTDLGEAEAMAFVFERPTSGAFFMFQTVTPLSIAWFSPEGAFVSSTEMEPCLDADSANCPRFQADGEYQVAIEVFQGDLDSIGLGDGSRIEILTDTEAPSCPIAAG